MSKPLRPIRVLVCGGRNKTLKKLGIDPGAVYVKLVRTMNEISSLGKRQVTVIHGGADGVDAWAGQWAAASHMPYEVYPITKEEWDALGPQAGHIRNAQMLRDGKPDVVLVFPGGNGTLDMLAQASSAGKRFLQVKVP